MTKKMKLSGHLLLGLGVFLIGIISVSAYCLNGSNNSAHEQEYCYNSNCYYHNYEQDYDNSNQQDYKTNVTTRAKKTTHEYCRNANCPVHNQSDSSNNSNYQHHNCHNRNH